MSKYDDSQLVEFLGRDLMTDEPSGVRLLPLFDVSVSSLVDFLFGDGTNGLMTDRRNSSGIMKFPQTRKQVEDIIWDSFKHNSAYRVIFHHEYGRVGLTGITDFNESERSFNRTMLIHPDYQGRGYGKATAKLIERNAYELGFGKIKASAQNDNLPSLGLKQGYTLTDIMMSKISGRRNLLVFELDLDRMENIPDLVNGRRVQLLRLTDYFLTKGDLNSGYSSFCALLRTYGMNFNYVLGNSRKEFIQEIKQYKLHLYEVACQLRFSHLGSMLVSS